MVQCIPRRRSEFYQTKPIWFFAPLCRCGSRFHRKITKRTHFRACMHLKSQISNLRWAGTRSHRCGAYSRTSKITKRSQRSDGGQKETGCRSTELYQEFTKRTHLARMAGFRSKILGCRQVDRRITKRSHSSADHPCAIRISSVAAHTYDKFTKRTHFVRKAVGAQSNALRELGPPCEQCSALRAKITKRSQLPAQSNPHRSTWDSATSLA